MTVGRLPSIEGGIQPTIFDAKADLLTAAAADTPARLAVGTNGQVLTADSTTATGLKWASAGSSFSGCSLFGSTVSVANDTEVYIDFGDENFDTDAYHSTSVNPSRITIPTGKSGKFQINARMSFINTSNSRLDMYLIKNAGTFLAQSIVDLERGATPMFSEVINAVAGDYFRLMVYQTSGGTISLNGGAQSQNFSIAYLGA
jgi:hypothetical protein